MMGELQFAAPGFLAGGLTLAVPFLLLLTKAQSRQTVLFSSTRFLKSVIKRASNAIEWKRLLLLFCRIMLLLCLALAFALPFMDKLYGRTGAAGGEHWVFVLDRSYSMAFSEDGRTLFDRGRGMIRDKVRKGNAPAQTELSLFLFDQRLIPVIVRASKTSAFLDKLNEVSVGDEKSDFSVLKSALDRQLSQEKSKPVRAYLISDFSVGDQKTAMGFEASFSDPGRRYRIDFFPVQPAQFQNIAVEEIIFPQRPFVPGVEEEIQVVIRSRGVPPGFRIALELWMAEVLLEKRDIEIVEPGYLAVPFRIRFPGTGLFPIRATMTPDALAPDDTRYAVASSRPPARILMIGDRNYRYAFEDPYHYFEQALISYDRNTEISNGNGGAGHWIQTARLHADDLPAFSLESYDMVMLADVSKVDPRGLNRLSDYVQKGGTVFFAVGSHFFADDFKSPRWSQFLGGAFLDEQEALSGPPPYRFEGVAWYHPMFRIFDEGKAGDLGRILVRRFVPFVPLSEARDRRILFFVDSKPALIEIADGDGRLILYTTTLNADWNDFPKDPLYVPFILELLKYGIAHDWDPPREIKAGQEIVFTDYDAQTAVQMTVTDPRGALTTLYGTPDNPVRSMRADRAGFYEWIRAEEGSFSRHMIASNLETQESFPVYWEFGKTEESPDPEVAHTVSEKKMIREKTYFYSPLLHTVFVLLMTESWLANRFYRQGLIL